MTLPAFTAGASLYATSEHYCSAGMSASGSLGSVLAQQFCRHLGQLCAGLELSCCPGLRCAPSFLHGICVPDTCPPCGPCQLNPSAATGCSQLCYFHRPFVGGCVPFNVPCDPPTCCTLLKESCIAGGGSVFDCSGLPPSSTCTGGCDCCPPCCFKCM
jgi:hypothetical protein